MTHPKYVFYESWSERVQRDPFQSGNTHYLITKTETSYCTLSFGQYDVSVGGQDVNKFKALAYDPELIRHQ